MWTAGDSSGSQTLTDDDSLYSIHVNELRTALDLRVIGPASGTDNALARFDGITGKFVQNSTVTLSDAGALAFSVVGTGNALVINTNNAAGGIIRAIRFNMGHTNDRPWLSWYDENGRPRVHLGYHSYDNNDDVYHNRFEIKTSTDPLAANPTLQLTRFFVETDKEFTNVNFGYLDTLQLSHTVYGQDTKFGITHVIPDSGGSAKAINSIKAFLASPNDDTIVEWDVGTVTTSVGAGLRFFRNTNTSGSRSITIFKGDGSSTQMIVLDAASGGIGLKSTSGSAGGGILFATDVNLYRSAADTLKTDDKLLAVAGLGVGNSAAATTLGSVTKRVPIFDATGASLGYIPVYDSIT